MPISGAPEPIGGVFVPIDAAPMAIGGAFMPIGGAFMAIGAAKIGLIGHAAAPDGWELGFFRPLRSIVTQVRYLCDRKSPGRATRRRNGEQTYIVPNGERCRQGSIGSYPAPSAP